MFEEKEFNHNLSDFPGLIDKMEEIRDLMTSTEKMSDSVFKNGVPRLVFQVVSIGDEAIDVRTAREIFWETANILLGMKAITGEEFKKIYAIDEQLARNLGEAEED